jgi:alkylated DNA repair dioxygenase AlkB
MATSTVAKPVRNDLDAQSFVEYYESFFDRPSADEYLAYFLIDDFPWSRQPVRGVITRRANAWFADDASLIYRYSGQVWEPKPLTPVLAAIRDRLEAVCNCGLNSVLAGLYPDGQAAVGWHDDNDFPSFPDTPIASVSLGSERRFMIRRKSDKQVVAEYDVSHGSLIIMGGAMQRCFDHAIQKTTKKVGPRVNLSYRRFRAANV